MVIQLSKMLVHHVCIYITVYCDIIFTAITVSFNQSIYSVTEHNGSVQPMLILSKPSPCPINVHVKIEDITAISKLCTLILLTCSESMFFLIFIIIS